MIILNRGQILRAHYVSEEPVGGKTGIFPNIPHHLYSSFMQFYYIDISMNPVLFAFSVTRKNPNPTLQCTSRKFHEINQFILTIPFYSCFQYTTH